MFMRLRDSYDRVHPEGVPPLPTAKVMGLHAMEKCNHSWCRYAFVDIRCCLGAFVVPFMPRR